MNSITHFPIDNCIIKILNQHGSLTKDEIIDYLFALENDENLFHFEENPDLEVEESISRLLEKPSKILKNGEVFKTDTIDVSSYTDEYNFVPWTLYISGEFKFSINVTYNSVCNAINETFQNSGNLSNNLFSIYIKDNPVTVNFNLDVDGFFDIRVNSNLQKLTEFINSNTFEDRRKRIAISLLDYGFVKIYKKIKRTLEEKELLHTSYFNTYEIHPRRS